MKKGFIITSVCALTLLTASAFAQSAKTQVKKAYYTWLHAVSTANGNPNAVLKLYAPHAVLLATIEPKPLTNHGELRKYFIKFTSLKDLHGKTDELITQVYPGFAVNSGLYTFTFKNAAGKKQVVPARFNFVYEKEHGKWLIVSHHSSALPKSK